MDNLCKEVISPTKKLTKFNTLLVIILIIFIFLFIFNLFFYQIDKTYIYIFLSINLLLIITSKYYKLVKAFSLELIISLMNNLINLGIILQNNYSIRKYYLLYLYYILVIIIHIISILLSFEIYKEMKRIYIEEYEKQSIGTELNDYNDIFIFIFLFLKVNIFFN